MRFMFNDRSRPERAARDLHRFMTSRELPSKYTRCQAAVALASGYRDWQELATVTPSVSGHGHGHVQASPLDGEAGEHITGLRRAWQAQAFASVLDIPSELGHEAAIFVMLTTSRVLVQASDSDVMGSREADDMDVMPTPCVPEATAATVAVWVMEWEESERGWGVRPDGYSIHPTKDDYKHWLAAYWERTKQGVGPDVVPDEYERPCLSSPVECIRRADHKVVLAMLAGVRRVYRHADNELCQDVRHLISMPTPVDSNGNPYMRTP